MRWPILLAGATGVLVAGVMAVAPASAATCAPVDHAREDRRALNSFWKTGVRLCRLPRGTYNAFAGLDEGVVYADQDWLDLVARRFGGWAATGILAHEWGHLVLARGTGRGTELQADCLAGVFLRGSGLGPDALAQFAAVNRFAASLPKAPASHGSPSQRAKAAMRGYEGFRGDTRPAALRAICPPSPR